MLTPAPVRRLLPLTPLRTTALFVLAMLLGGVVGGVAPQAGETIGSAIDPLIMALVATLFFTTRIDGLRSLRSAPKTWLLAIGMNFIVIPPIAFCLTSLLLPDSAMRLGVLIYCLAPCTDWFLGFTRVARGDTTTGAGLIPLQMTLQLLLYPVWLALFAGAQVVPTADSVLPALAQWFVLPALVAIALRLVLRAAPLRVRDHVVSAVDALVPFVIAALIVSLFASNIGTILGDIGAAAQVLLVVFLFFVTMWWVGKGVSRLFRLPYPQHALLTMTTSARNAPMMLAVTTIALPDQPVVAAAIVLGMLIEFPHLTVITQLLLRRAPAEALHRSDAALAA